MARYKLPDNLGSILDVMDRSRRRFANGGPTEAVADTTAPSPVANLAGTTGYYRDTVQGVDLAYVDLTWDLIVPVEDSSPSAGDGTDPAKAPVDHYAIRYRLGGSGNFTSSTNSKTNSARVSGLPPGNSVELQVAAVTTTGATSSWASVTVNLSQDAGAPNAPSTPTVTGTYGGVRASWDGLDSGGASMPSDFDHADYHASVTSGFTPSASTKYVSVLGAGTVTIPHPSGASATTPVYVKIVAYDISGNASTASAQGSASPSTIVATEVADGSITETKIANDAVTTPKILANSVDASKIAALTITAGQIAAGAITGTKIAAGAITADIIATGTLNASVLISAGSFANGSNRVEFDRNGIRLISRSAGGVDTTVVDLNTNTGNGTFTGTVTGGTVQTAVSGTRVTLTGSSVGRISFYSGDATESAPGYVEGAPSGTGGAGGAVLTMQSPISTDDGASSGASIQLIASQGASSPGAVITMTAVKAELLGGYFRADNGIYSTRQALTDTGPDVTSIATTSTTYTTTGAVVEVYFTAPPSQAVLLTVGGRLRSGTAGNQTYLGVEVRNTNSGGSIVSAVSDNDALMTSSGNHVQASTSRRVGGLTPGNTYYARLLHKTTAGTGNIDRRRLIVIPSL